MTRPPITPLLAPNQFPHTMGAVNHRLLYAFSVVDGGGRVTAKSLITSLGWGPGTELAVQATDGALVLTPLPGARVTVTAQYYIRIPYRDRRKVNLFQTDRVLLAGCPVRHCLAIVPPAFLDDTLREVLP